MKKETFYIMAKDSTPESIYTAVAVYMGTFDSLQDAIKYGVNYAHKTVIELTTYDGNIISDDDIKIAYTEE